MNDEGWYNMNKFDRYSDVPKANVWDVQENKIPINDGIKSQRNPLWLKIVAYILLGALLLGLIYGLLHPVNKVKLKFLLTQNCTIEVVATYGYKETRKNILIDGNLLQVGSEYYEIDDEKLYTYIKNYNGEWERVLSEDDEFSIEDSEIGIELLKRSNYQRAKGRLFVWSLKKYVEADIDGLSNITFQRDAGKLAIVGYYNGVRISLRFTNFGKTNITPPWEK